MTTSTQSADTSAARRRRQLPSLLRASHPRQALVIAVVVGALVGLSTSETEGGRIVSTIVLAAAAVLVSQLITGLMNDLLDVDLDRASGSEDKPVALGVVPPGNASFAIAVLLLVVIPLSLQNGTTAGLFLLATLVVAYVHNRWLHRTPLSWVGWAATFALLAEFVTWAGYSRGEGGSAPLTWFVLLSAALGICVHFLTSLPDLVRDNASRVRHLPLRVALHTGAAKLLVISGVVTLLVVATLVVQIVSVGTIRQ
jgi:4-hydroxybenzoate polyprenyltransferase